MLFGNDLQAGVVPGFRRTSKKEEGRNNLGRLLKAGRHDLDVINGAARGQNSQLFLRNWRPLLEMKEVCQPNY